MLITTTLSGCFRIITTDEFTPELMLSIVEKYMVTHFVSPPTSLSMVLKSPEVAQSNLSSLQFWLCGGSATPHERIEQMKKHLSSGQIVVSYGLTEIAGGVAIGFPNIKPHTVGQLVAGIEVKIVDENGNRVGVGVDGEICVDSKYKFLGYYGNQSETDAMFDEEGFLRSGDIGHFDDEGDLFVMDRQKDIFKYRSCHISPTEIENVILKNDGVQLACVFGIPDIECMDLPAAAIVKAGGSNITVAEINEIVKNNLNDSCQLRGGIFFFDSLPMTPSGKILRRKVREIVMALYAKSKSIKSAL